MEEGNLNSTAQALLPCNDKQVDALDVYLKQRFHRKVGPVEDCSHAACMLPFGFCLLPFERP